MIEPSEKLERAFLELIESTREYRQLWFKSLRPMATHRARSRLFDACCVASQWIEHGELNDLAACVLKRMLDTGESLLGENRP